MKHTIYISRAILYRVNSRNHETGKVFEVADNIGSYADALTVANRFEDRAKQPSPLTFEIEQYEVTR